MITILTSIEAKDQVVSIIKKVNRLEELVLVTTTLEHEDFPFQLEINNNKISSQIDWMDKEPPYLLPEVEFTTENLLALVFFKLGNHQKAIHFTDEDSELHFHFMIASSIQHGYSLDERLINDFLTPHNRCIVKHYGVLDCELTTEKLKNEYLNTIIDCHISEYKAFTLKHYCNLLIDLNLFKEAEELLKTNLYENHLSHKASNALRSLLATTMMSQLSLPFDSKKLNEILDIQLECIAFYESIGEKINAGLVYIDTSEIANYKKDYVTSKAYINQAIFIFKEEEIPEFLGEASLRKATLLYTWSKNGSPQYYKPAINAFQDTLKIFKKDVHPEKFADIHHNLALIYSEIPTSPEEKPIWTAFSASSFKEVLGIYTKDEYPYQFAMACHNYGTALMGFPEAKLHNNLIKAENYFNEALSIRTTKDYPFERALTLLNQLELFWIKHNNTQKEEQKNIRLMKAKAKEIKTLISDKTLIEKADEHLSALKKLKIEIN